MVANVHANLILAALPRAELAALQKRFRLQELKRDDVLYPAGASIDFVYFPLSGMVSFLAMTKGGEAIETGIIGHEGVAGASVATGVRQAFNQAMVQIEGYSMRMSAADFTEAYRAHPRLRALSDGYQGYLLAQAQQNAACHALHGVNERLCRWLLQAQDASQTKVFQLTHEFLSNMLGVRRTTISLVAHQLQEAGLIRYRRGSVQILERQGLEEGACECYGVLKTQLRKVFPGS